MDPVTTSRLSPSGRRWRWIAAAIAASAIAILASAAAVWWLAWRPREEPLRSDWKAVVFVTAGNGLKGSRDGPEGQARFTDPFGISVTSDGMVLVSDSGDVHGIRVVTPYGHVLTLAGGRPGFLDGRGSAARFDTPSGLALDRQGTLYVADTANNAIRRVTLDGHVTTVAGDGVPGFRDGPAAQARFNAPIGVAVDTHGRIIVADTYNDRVRAIGPDGRVTTLAGTGMPGALDGPAEQATFDTPSGVAVDERGTIYVADTGNGLVRVLESGVVSTLPVPPDGLVRPVGIAVGDERVYVTDDRGRVLELASTGSTRTIAGSSPGFHDGPGREARLRGPMGIAFAAPGRLLVADTGNALVRTIVAEARQELRPPASPFIHPRFDAERFGMFPLLWPVAPMDGPHEVAGTIGEARGGQGSERFHAGIDVRAEQRTPVHAVREGVVTAPVASGAFGTLNEWLRIGPLAYVHVRTGRDRVRGKDQPFDDPRFATTYDERGHVLRVRLKRGAKFRTGEVIATVNQFNHVHLNVGPPGEEYNPLGFRLTRFVDTIAPAISRRGIRLFDSSGQEIATRRRGRLVVSGQVQIVVDAWDRADGNRPGRRLGLYELGYQVLQRDGTPVAGFEDVRRTITFDRLAGDGAAGLVYADGSGIPFYGRRVTRFLYAITNTYRDGIGEPGWWNTTDLPPGDYILRVFASDIQGNVATANRDLPVTIEPEPLPAEQAVLRTD